MGMFVECTLLKLLYLHLRIELSRKDNSVNSPLRVKKNLLSALKHMAPTPIRGFALLWSGLLRGTFTSPSNTSSATENNSPLNS